MINGNIKKLRWGKMKLKLFNKRNKRKELFFILFFGVLTIITVYYVFTSTLFYLLLLAIVGYVEIKAIIRYRNKEEFNSQIVECEKWEELK